MRQPRWIPLAVLAYGLAPAGAVDPPRVPPSDSPPVLSRDGQRVFFISRRNGLPQVHAGDIDAAERKENVVAIPGPSGAVHESQRQ